MPPRAEPGDRRAIEAALGPGMRAALHEVCDLLQLPRDRWQRVLALDQLFTTIAVRRLSLELARERRLAERPAIEAAAIALGVNGDTARGRLETWYRAARQGSVTDPRDLAAGNIVDP